MKKVWTSFSLVLITLFLFGQTPSSIKNISEAIESHGVYEKIYLHTDRDYYTGGGDLFFKVYLTTEALSTRNAKSKVAYVDLIGPDQQIIESKTIAIKKGLGNGDFKITSKFKSGNYVLRAYTKYMKNFDSSFFFRKAIYIRGVTNLDSNRNIAATAPMIQFFPEGGDLVNNVASTIAIKATNASGKGLALKGKVKTGTGALITEITTNKKGFGQFNFQPEVGQSYLFEGVYNGQEIQKALPTALSEGAVLVINNQAEDQIQLQVTTNQPAILDGGYLIGQGMGQLFYEKKIGAQANTELFIDVTEIPFGVLHFTLFDNLGQPRAERLVFNHDGIDNFNVDITPDQTTYGKREKVQIQLDAYDDDGETLKADLSLSIVSNYLASVNFNKDNIQSYLLLSSDIKGIIENPTAYFKDNEPTTKKALDLLLMTQGWRRFSWQDVLKQPVKAIKYLPEQSLSIVGKITKKDNENAPIKAVGYLSELSANLSLTPFETDEAGHFTIDNLYATNGTDLILQAAVLDKKQQKVKRGSTTLKGNRSINIEIADKLPPVVDKKDMDTYFLVEGQQATVQNLTNLENIQYKNDLSYNEVEDWSIELDSISVTAKKIDEVVEYYEDGMLYKRPDTRIRMDEVADPNMHKNVLTVINGAPGMEVDVANASVVMRGRQTGLSANINLSNKARFMVNGALVSQEFATSINPMNIAFIDIVRSLNKLNMFGEVGNNGLIMIYLKVPEDQTGTKKEVEGVKTINFKGYDEAREFYAPTYDITNREDGKVDNRITLHWAPAIQFNEAGEAYIEFYTSDRTGPYDIIVEGISSKGLPIIAQSKIMVK